MSDPIINPSADDAGTSVPTTPLTPAQPVYPPVDATRPVPPITPFPAWTWTTPVIPQFYWNVYSAEQRIRQICVEIGKIQSYLEYMAANANAAHWYLDNRFTQTETRLTARIDALDKELDAQVTALTKLITDEQTAREAADTALGERIDGVNTDLSATKDALAAETAARKTADATLQTNIDNEAKLRNNADVNFDMRLTEETSARTEKDTQLSNELTTETKARTDADAALDSKITAETTARTTADNLLRQQVNNRVKAVNVKAADGSKITVTATSSDTDPDKTTVTIGSTFDADFKSVNDKIAAETTARTAGDAALQKNIDTETAERRAQDELLQTDVNSRLKFGAVLGANGVTVTNDPDKSTATVKITTEGVQANADHNVALSHATGRDAAGIAFGDGLVKVADDNEGEHLAVDPAFIDAHAGMQSVAVSEPLTGDGTTEHPINLPLSDNLIVNAYKRLEAEIHTGDGLSGTGTVANPIGITVSGNASYATAFLPLVRSGTGSNVLLGTQFTDLFTKVGSPTANKLSLKTGNTLTSSSAETPSFALQVNAAKTTIPEDRSNWATLHRTDATVADDALGIPLTAPLTYNRTGHYATLATHTNGALSVNATTKGLQANVDGTSVTVNGDNQLSVNHNATLTVGADNKLGVNYGDGLEVQNGKLQVKGVTGAVETMDYDFARFEAIDSAVTMSALYAKPVPGKKILSVAFLYAGDDAEPNAQYLYSVAIQSAQTGEDAGDNVVLIKQKLISGALPAEPDSVRHTVRVTYQA